MNGYLWTVGGATVIFAGVISYAMTRRYGWGAALTLPVLALVLLIAMQWQAQGLNVSAGLGLIKAALGFAAPILLGAVTGIAVARLRRG